MMESQNLNNSVSGAYRSLTGAGAALEGNRNTPRASFKRKRSMDVVLVESADNYFAETEMKQESCTIVWSLKNFTSFIGREEVKSPIFKGGPKMKHSWQLKLCPKKKFDEQEYVTIHVILVSFGDGDNSYNRTLKVKFQISFLDMQGTQRRQAGSLAMEPCEFKKSSVWGYENFLLTRDLINENARYHHLLAEDTIHIRCQLWVIGDIKHSAVSRAHRTKEEQVKRRKEMIVADFSRLLHTNLLTDFEIMARNNSFPAHKIILAARSEYFAAMFESNPAVAFVEVRDYDDDIVKAMLDYVYSGETELLNQLACKLLEIADKFNLAGLKEECEVAMLDNLNVENSINYLILANTYNAPLLKARAIAFINKFKEEVMKTDAFQVAARSNQHSVSVVFVDLYMSQ